MRAMHAPAEAVTLRGVEEPVFLFIVKILDWLAP
jgi:hypothetical protein